ncbi:MAG: glycosyltransferase [bacterium]
MKIYALADLASNWYPHQAFRHFQHYSKVEFVTQPSQAHLIWIMSYYLSPAPLLTWPFSLYKLFPLTTYKKRSLTKIPVITTIHHLTPAKKDLWLPTINLLDKITDSWQTSSRLNAPYIKQFISKPLHLLPYWIDTEQFYPLSAKQHKDTRDMLKLPRQKTIVGSFQRDTEDDLTSPKLEKGPDIFCDIVEQLNPKDIFVLLSGPRRHYTEKRLSAKQIPYRSLGKVPFQQMNSIYNTLDYYLVTSRHEGGPQAILEAMATNTKIFSTRVGVADLLSPQVIFSNAKQCVALLNQPYPDVLSKHQQTITSYSHQNVIPQFEQFFNKLVKDKEFSPQKHI